MNRIKILDEVTVNKIAAGEIIERPASIVKELVENSIDAGAKNIVVEIKDAGKSYIRVTDDGKGIPNDEVDLAFKRHSTSKIEFIEDLSETISLGFRGEALASISTVSKMETLTKTKDSLKGSQLYIENGKVIEKNIVGCPIGTTMIVKDLFYNIPVRKKFLKSNITESKHISDLIYKLALGNSNISFKYIKDDRVVINTPGNNDLSSNIYLLLGKEFVENLKEVYYEDDVSKIYGYISNNIFYRGSRAHQYVYINNRYIKSHHISKIVEEKYKTLIPINKFPVFILFIEIDPMLIDVNIHPTKQEVKIEQQYMLDVAINKCINSAIHSLYSVPKVELSKKKKKKTEYEDITFLDIPKENMNSSQKDEKKPVDEIRDSDEDYNDYNNRYENINYKNIDNNSNSYNHADYEDVDYNNINYEDVDDNNLYSQNKAEDSVEKKSISRECKRDKNSIDNHDLKTKSKGDKFPLLTDLKIIGIAFKTYIITQDNTNDSLYIIDQHASHERILYEKYKKEYKNEKVIIQKMLAPEIIDLTDQELSVFKENIDLFRKLGFEIDEFGMNSIALRGVPVLFGKPNYKELFFDILDNFNEDIESNYEMRLEKIMKIACSNAVKAGDEITEIEVYNLFKQLEEIENPYTCPHGRPTIIKMTKQELEKQFKRIM
ncbi:MAG TPA: DNA mismatch repair endonuclease MutL [Tissierellales bacterium]|nr:DNA mismatch repair endonuclease MutL [Tissierellales bacterium]